MGGVLRRDGGVVDGAEEDGFVGPRDSLVLNPIGRSKALTAYAMRSPFASEESGVGCPLVVDGEAAQMASACCLVGYNSRALHTYLT